MKKIAVIALVLLLSLTAGWGALADEKRPLTITTGDIQTLDPAFADTANDQHILPNIFETLVELDFDLSIKPALAESWEVSDDGTIYTFHLRKGVKFHDGTEMDAQAVKFSFDRAFFDPKAHLYRERDNFKDFKVIDKYTFQIVLNNPLPSLLKNLPMVVSPAAVEKYGEDFGFHPVGTGPFQFEEWISGDRLILKRFDDYWRGPAKLDTVVFRNIPESDTVVAELLKNNLDIAGPPKAYLRILDQKENLKLMRSPGLNIRYIGINVTKEPWNDVRVRRAANYAVDAEAIIKNVHKGFGFVAKGPLPNAVWAHNPDLPLYGYDPDKARELLAEAGYPNGFKTNMIAWESDTYLPIAKAVVEYWRQVGIDCQLRIYDWSTYLDVVNNEEKFDTFIFGWTGPVDPHDYLWDLFHSKSDSNHSLYSGSDELLDKAKTETDPEKRKQLYYQIQEDIVKAAPWIWIENMEIDRIVNTRVKNFRIHPTGIYVLRDVYIEEED